MEINRRNIFHNLLVRVIQGRTVVSVGGGGFNNLRGVMMTSA